MLFAREECDKWMIGETCYLRLNKLVARFTGANHPRAIVPSKCTKLPFQGI